MYEKVFQQFGRTGAPLDYPQLLTKGAIARHMVPVLRLVVRGIVDWAPESLGNASERMLFGHVSKLLDALTNFYECLFFNGLWLSRHAAAEAAQLLEDVGLHHQALTDWFLHTDPRHLFLLTDKAHFVQHLGQDCLNLRLNPRCGWTYSDEDWVGRIGQIAAASTRGRGPIRLGAPVVDRWRFRMFTAWKRRARSVA